VACSARVNRLVAQKRTYRSQAEVSRFFDGLDLLPPGVVPVPRWRPADEPEASAPTMAWAGMARSPAIPGTRDRTLHTVVYKLEK
jgi:hypothetical protein